MNEAKFVAAFAEKLRAVPHRDVTHVPYAEWFSLYATLTRQLTPSHASAPAPASSRPYLRLVDSMLWSSLVAQRWNAVDLFLDERAIERQLKAAPGTRAETNSESSHASATPWGLQGEKSGFSEQAWYRRLTPSRGLALGDVVAREAAHTDTRNSTSAAATGASHLAPSSWCELLAPDFLSEPLLGGQSIETWRGELRQQSARLHTISPTASTTSDNDIAKDVDPTSSILVVPFSSLWAIKEQAFLHTSTAQKDGRALTVQERGARQVLLQSVHQLLQLQVELNDKRAQILAAGGAGGGAVTTALSPRLQLAVLSPSEEFGLLCSLPRLCRAWQASRRSRDHSTPPSPSPLCLQLSAVCESQSARLVYLLYSQLVPATPSHQWALVAPAGTHTEWRRCADGALQAIPMRVQSVLHDTLANEVPQSLGSGLGRGLGTGPRSIHRQARQGCQDAVRRMTQREENLRQSYSQK